MRYIFPRKFSKFRALLTAANQCLSSAHYEVTQRLVETDGKAAFSGDRDGRAY